MKRTTVILLAILTPLFVASGLGIPAMLDPFNLSRTAFMESELDAKHSLPTRNIVPVVITLTKNELNQVVFSPNNSTVFVGVNNTIHLKNLLQEQQTVTAENMYFHLRTISPNQIHGVSINAPGEYSFHLENDAETSATITVLPSILSQTYHFPKKFGEHYHDWQNPRGATIVRNFSFSQSNGDTQDWSDFYSDVPNDIKIKGIELVLLGSISGAFPAGVVAELTWDGQHYTDTGKSVMWDDSLVSKTLLGGNDDLWGHHWTGKQLEGENFGVKLEKIGDPNSTVNIDQIAIKVFLD